MLIPVTLPEALSEQSLVFRKALSELLHAQKSQGFRFGLFAPPCGAEALQGRSRLRRSGPSAADPFRWPRYRSLHFHIMRRDACRRSMDSRSEASRASRAALTCLMSGKGIPSCRALFCTASFGRLSTTDARAADAPFIRRARSSSICSGVQLRLVMRGIRNGSISISPHPAVDEMISPFRHFGLFDLRHYSAFDRTRLW
jgi:hypothetical protein